MLSAVLIVYGNKDVLTGVGGRTPPQELTSPRSARDEYPTVQLTEKHETVQRKVPPKTGTPIDLTKGPSRRFLDSVFGLGTSYLYIFNLVSVALNRS